MDILSWTQPNLTSPPVDNSSSSSSSSSSWVSQQLTQFLVDSSVRCLRRTVRSDDAVLRTFWTVFVLACLAGMTAHLALVSSNFIQGDLAVDLQFSAAANQPFPSVSYCDGQRFSPDAALHWAAGRFLTPANFSAHVRQQVRQFYLRQPDSEKGYLMYIESYYNYLATVLGYLASDNRSLHDIADLGMPAGTILVRVILVTGRVTWLLSADLATTPFHHPEYLNCYTIALPDEVSKQAASVTLVLPAPTSAANSSTERDRQLATSFPIDGLATVSGFVFDLHSWSDVPFALSKLLLPVGFYNRVKFTQCSLTRLTCTSQDGWWIEHRGSNGSVGRSQLGYTKELCIIQRIRSEVQRLCNCTLDISLMNLTDRSPRCNGFAAGDSIETYGARDTCVDGVLGTAMQFGALCQSQCQERWFPATVSGAPYNPQSELQRCSLERMLYMVNHLGVSITELEADFLANSSLDSATTLLQLCSSGEARTPAFLVELSRNPFLMQDFRQSSITSLSVFLCQVGSICGIWAGLSIAVFAELADLAYCLVRSRRKPVVAAAAAATGVVQQLKVAQVQSAV